MKIIFIKSLVLILIVLFIGAGVVPSISSYEPISNHNQNGTHMVLAEFGTTTWCSHCGKANAAIKNVYNNYSNDFYYVSLVNDKDIHAEEIIDNYNPYGYPTVWFDGGYSVEVGSGNVNDTIIEYIDHINYCQARDVADINTFLSVEWIGNATMNISLSIQNNETSVYNGYLKVYVTEIVSSMGWHDTLGNPYNFTFLDYAFNQTVTISSLDTWHGSIEWNGHLYDDGHGNDFSQISNDNIMVIAAVFNDTWHQGYSYPPMGYPFDAYYLDYLVGTTPKFMDYDIFVDDDSDPSWYDATHVRTIQEGIDNATVGDTIFVYNGLYIENVVVDKSIDLIGEDKNSTIINNVDIGPIIRIESNDVNISGFSTEDIVSYHSWGIYVESDNVSIFENNINGNACCIRLSGNYTKIYDNNILNYHYGIWMEYYPLNDSDVSHHNMILNNVFYDTIYSGIILFNSSNNLIEGNIFNNSEILLFKCYKNNLYDNNLSLGNIRIIDSNNNKLRNNSINNGGLSLEWESFNTLTEFYENIERLSCNDVDTSNTVNGKPIYYYINESDLDVPLNAGQVIFVNCSNSSISNLDINNTYYAIEVISSENIEISNNTISDNYHGTFILIVNDSYFINNQIINNTQGMDLICSNNNSIINNINNYNLHAISLLLSNNSVLHGNEVGFSQRDGLRLIGSNNNTIFENSIHDNGLDIIGKFGIIIEPEEQFNITSDNNILYCNNFINNEINANDSCNNFWDNGYPSGGNYWDDYIGVDNNHGPNQDIPGSDGIGDSPYDIPGGTNQDLYPLMYFNPIVNFTYYPLNPTRLDIIQFNDTSSNGNGDITNYSWEFGDGYGSFLQNPTHQYTELGAYLVNLTVTDNSNYSNEIQKTIIISNIPPLADFDYMPLEPQSNIQINFTDLTYDLDGYIESWYWEFGDGHSSTIQNPSHTYASSGIYSITLEVTDNDGDITTVSKLALVDYELLSITNLSLNWNFISSPYNLTLHKNELFIRYDSYYYNWAQATTNINPAGEPLINPFIFGWDRPNQTYHFTDWLKSGYGYWLFTYHYCDIYIAEFDPLDDDYITSMEQGWNIVGVPYDQSVEKEDIIVDYNGTAYNWTDAVINNIVNNFVFDWNRHDQSYTFSDTFIPGDAYWVYSYLDCEIYALLDNFTIKAKYYYFRSYRNGGGIFPIYIIPLHDFDGNVSLSINADANLNAQLDRNMLNTSSMIAELAIRPNNNTLFGNHTIEVSATQGNVTKKIYLVVEMINVIIGEPDSYLTGKRDKFISWLESEHPELGNLSNQNWFAYKTYPQIIVVSHWTFLSLEWEFRICCHNTIPPYNWSKMCLRRLGEIEPVLAAYLEYDGTTYEIPVDDYPIKYGY